MTLLIGTVARLPNPSKSHVVITADGRCTGFDGTRRITITDSLQKIFPVANAPVAIVHHGENQIANTPVNDFLSVFMQQRSQDMLTLGIGELADKLVDYAKDRAVETLRRITASKVIGFWLGGFFASKSQPDLFEIIWRKHPETGEIVFEEKRDHELVFMLGGDASGLIKQYHDQPIDGMYDWRQIPSHTVKYASKFHAKLYRLAENAEASESEQTFGGCRHQLEITRDKRCSWSAAPPQQWKAK